ncbi:chemotaxis protein CheC [Paucibacter sp. TC2R-5]|uniref:chemotaxis protein CheC n=1 Tax=Paucibacter sp. TC2R-5 TaxID=2893555 RepID=UPI0021E43849|nr:chemotaxis protein CheC [Paucibacter sp. TC2R-5]MCV2359168.1 chemotaxis protein CheC [Paucibacter sp. TC2R-5]
MRTQLGELERDALAEAFNLALGEAASSFADIVNEEVHVSVPEVEILTRQQLVERLAGLPSADSNPALCSISQSFHSADTQLATETLLLFPERGGLEIVRRMLGDTGTPLEHVSELEQDALGEIGNIIINSCMSSLAGIFKTEMIGTLPSVERVLPLELFGQQSQGDIVLVARIGMRMSSQDVTGFVLFLMDLPSLETVISLIQRFFGLADDAAAPN